MTNSYFDELLSRHRNKPLVLDTNLLCVLCTGEFDIKVLGRFNRTDGYNKIEYNALKSIVENSNKIITLPNILTELTNLINLSGKLRDDFSSFLKTFFEKSIEIYLPSEKCFEDLHFKRLGLTDAGIIMLSKEGYLVMSVDLELCVAIERNGNDVINFNHVRTMLW